MRALLIEDHRVVSDSIRMMLAPEDFEVDIIAFGKDGVTTARTGDYDVILLDLILPDIDGYDVLRQLRGAGVAAPILVLSGLDEIENKTKCLENGADDYLAKPIDRGKFIARVNALTRSANKDAPLPFDAGPLTVNLDTNTFLMLYR